MAVYHITPGDTIYICIHDSFVYLVLRNILSNGSEVS